MNASRNAKRALQRQVPTRPADLNRVVPCLQQPLLSCDIPDTQVPPREREGHSRSLPSHDGRLLKSAKLPHGHVLTRNAEVQLGHLLAVDAARVGNFCGDGHELVPEVGLAAQGDGTGRVLICGAVDLADLQVAVVEGGVAESEAKFVARGNVLEIKVAVVDVDSLSEVGLGEVLEHAVEDNIRLEEVVVVGFILGHCVWDTSGGVLLAIEEVDESPAAVLPWEMGKDDGRDVGVVCELVYKTNAGVVEHNDGVGTLISDVVDQAVGVVIADRRPVIAFRGPDVAEYDTGVACGVDQGVIVLEVPVKIGGIFVCLGNKCIVWRADEALRGRAGSSTADQCAILSDS